MAFFARFLARNYLEGLSAERGGGKTVLSLDWETADTKFQLRVASTNEPSPDKAFYREWAVTMLTAVIERLRAECDADGRAKQFDQLKIFLTVGKGAAAHADVACWLDMDEGAVRVAVHRLRNRYRDLLRAEIAHTLADLEQVDEEMRALFGAFASWLRCWIRLR